jgi:O-antigen ligase
MLALALPVAGGAWAMPVIVLALLATRSKAAILGALAGAAVRWRVPAWVLGLGALATVIALNRGMSDTHRIYIWGVAWRTFLAHPLLGVGADNFGDAFMALRDATWLSLEGGALSGAENAHNLVLNVLATGGVLGLLTRGILAWKAYPAVRSNRALTASYASVLVYSLFNPVCFEAWAVLAFMLGSL